MSDDATETLRKAKLKEAEAVLKTKALLERDNIISEEAFHYNVDFVFKKIAESVSRTMGPAGAYALITNRTQSGKVFPTKDGYTVINEYRFNDQIKFFIAETIKDISRRMNQDVGDSTTSGLPIGYKLYQEIRKYDLMEKYPLIGSHLSPLAIRNLLDAIRSALADVLKADFIMKIVDPLDTASTTSEAMRIANREEEDRMIRTVARLSANNNRDLADEVSQLFIDRSSNNIYITAEVRHADDTIVDKEIGFEFGSSIIHSTMANMPDRITCEFENPKYLLVDGVLTQADMNQLDKLIKYCINDLKQPIIIVAKDYVQEVRNNFQFRRATAYNDEAGNLQAKEAEPIAALEVNSEFEISANRLKDLSAALGGIIISTKQGEIIKIADNVDMMEKYFGSSDKFTSNPYVTRVKGGHGDKVAIQARIESLEDDIRETEAANGELAFSNTASDRKRIAMLNSDMTIIRVGGANEKERTNKKLIYDDIILSCKSAIAHGFTLGGNVAIPYIVRTQADSIAETVVDTLIKQGIPVIYGNDRDNLIDITKDFLKIVGDSFEVSYRKVVENMVGLDTVIYEKVCKEVYEAEELCVTDLITAKINTLNSDSTVLVPGNTPLELLTGIFSVVGNLASSNQFISILPGDAAIYGSSKE